ncbi:MAG: hypothetical protein ACQETG_10710 [Thermodesulfobacteriota bacterium]
MSRREKIIVGLMIAALLYAAFELLVPAREQNDSQSPQEELQSAEQVAENISGEMQDSQLAPGEIHVLELAGRKWERDPFYRLPENPGSGTDKAGDNGESDGLSYTGYLDVGGNKMAIINGIEYRPGQQLENTDAVIQSVTAQRVVLRSKETGEQITLEYKK